MNQKRFHNATHASKGFTLVEIAIVMIIIGLLIGGIFGGMKLIDNANVQKTIQDYKVIDSAGLTFRDIYRGLPGDLRNANTKIPNCATGPCSVSGNGDRRIGGFIWEVQVIFPLLPTSETFLFGQHLLAADLISGNIQPNTTMSYGEGLMSSPLGGYWLNGLAQNGMWATPINNKHVLLTTNNGDNVIADSVDCNLIRAIDKKMDDDHPVTGRYFVLGWCMTPHTAAGNWVAQTGPYVGLPGFVLSY